MKIGHRQTGSVVYLVLEGDLDGVELAAAWARHAGAAPEIDIDMADCDLGDAAGATVLVSLIHDELRAGRRVRLRRAPQVLNHSLYRVGLLLEGSGLTLIEPRQDEPYA